jgi:hypothetical protein
VAVTWRQSLRIVPDGSPVNEPSLSATAVLVALAGVRRGQSVVVLGPSTVLRLALEAAAERPLADQGPADVVVALSAPEIPGAVLLLRPGGRLVTVSADNGAVERTAARHGLLLRHAERVGGEVAWSASLPT